MKPIWGNLRDPSRAPIRGGSGSLVLWAKDDDRLQIQNWICFTRDNRLRKKDGDDWAGIAPRWTESEGRWSISETVASTGVGNLRIKPMGCLEHTPSDSRA
ncbi:hypothetical protein CC2G_005802 [Coprinopsis cinerea AmutBmut pab1-1]|nr:hypothetical protein CC2G_005802 [Coprinopsis cinerea AmutBmut pab1-1]